jgi:hypothetical protein
MDKKAFGIPLSDIISEVIYQVFDSHNLTLDERMHLANFIDDSLLQLTRQAETCALPALLIKLRSFNTDLRQRFVTENNGEQMPWRLNRFTCMSREYKQSALQCFQRIAEFVEKAIECPPTAPQ